MRHPYRPSRQKSKADAMSFAAMPIRISPSTIFSPAVSPQRPSARLAKRCRRVLPVLKFLRPFLISVCPMATCGRCLPKWPSMGVHAEEDDIVTYMTEKLIREGNAQGHNLHLVHNNLSEDLAFRKIVRLARHTEVGVYFVHTTAKEGVAAIAEARSQGQPVYGEALHNYLEFTCEDYKKPGGTAIHTYPAIKFAEDRDALLAGLLDGRLCTTATDEYTTYKGVKLSGNTIQTVCGGHNGIETRLPVAFTKFVAQRRMSLQRFAAIIATNAAKILGLYPQKGVITPGSDADLVLIDPNLHKTLTLD